VSNKLQRVKDGYMQNELGGALSRIQALRDLLRDITEEDEEDEEDYEDQMTQEMEDEDD
jgi:hypothetical protein